MEITSAESLDQKPSKPSKGSKRNKVTKACNECRKKKVRSFFILIYIHKSLFFSFIFVVIENKEQPLSVTRQVSLSIKVHELIFFKKNRYDVMEHHLVEDVENQALNAISPILRVKRAHPKNIWNHWNHV